MKRPMKLFICSLVTFSLVILIGFIAFTSLLHFVVRDQTALRKRNEIRDFYEKLPFPMEFRIYFFNVTNTFEAQNGAKPILKEVGPYFYDAYKEKIDVVDNPTEDSLTYTPHDTYISNAAETTPLSHSDYVTILHPLMVGLINTVNLRSPSLLPLINKAIPSLFNYSQTVYLTAKVSDILFDGILVNCTSRESKPICLQMKAIVPGFKQVNKGIYSFSLIQRLNGTQPNARTKVKRGIKNSQDLGRILEVRNEKKLSYWSTKQCNTFRGTDGWIFPPLMKNNEDLWVYSSELCRNMKLAYYADVDFHGVKSKEYRSTLGDMSTVPEEKCYCPSSSTCWKKGVMDLIKCTSIPLYATLPHFLYTDESYRSKVIGLNPVKKKHVIRVVFEPLTGSPLEARKRLQFNFVLEPVNKISITRNVSKTLHPILWLEEGVALKGKFFKKVSNIFLLLKIAAVIKWIALIASIAGMITAGFMQYRNKHPVNVTPKHNADDEPELSEFSKNKSASAKSNSLSKKDSSTSRNNNEDDANATGGFRKNNTASAQNSSPLGENDSGARNNTLGKALRNNSGDNEDVATESKNDSTASAKNSSASRKSSPATRENNLEKTFRKNSADGADTASGSRKNNTASAKNSPSLRKNDFESRNNSADNEAVATESKKDSTASEKNSLASRKNSPSSRENSLEKAFRKSSTVDADAASGSRQNSTASVRKSRSASRKSSSKLEENDLTSVPQIFNGLATEYIDPDYMGELLQNEETQFNQNRKNEEELPKY